MQIPFYNKQTGGIHKEIGEVKAGVVVENDAEQIAKAIANLLDNPLICKKKEGERRAISRG